MLITSWGIRSAVTGPRDPYFSNVVLLLNGQGTDGGTIWNDLSQYRHPVISNGAITSTAQFKWGNSSTLNSTTANTNNFVSTTANYSEFIFGTDEFTVEIWFYLTTINVAQILVQRNSTNGSLYPWQLYVTSGNNLTFRGFNNASSLIYSAVGVTTLTTGQWYFVQARRRNAGGFANFDLALNGTQDGTYAAALSTQLYDNSSPIDVGNYSDVAAEFPLIGYWEDCRVTWKVARDFGVPISAFPTS